MPERSYPSSQQQRSKTVVHMAWFTPEDYPHLVKSKKAQEEFEADYDSWHKKAKKDMMKTVSQGKRVAKITVDVKVFKAWCKEHKKPVDNESLDLYITLPPSA